MIRYLLILIAAVFLVSCQKDESGENPFDTIINNQDTVGFTIENADPNSIAGLYQNIFKPTCANVACHDGTFEPDFRTIESSFNTMVLQEPIKNNGNYDYRVEPFKPDQSVIMARLNNIIGPQMPFTLEPDSDWPAKSSEYIQNIRTWIQNGAKDLSGNSPSELYPAPILLGAGAIVSSNWMQRNGGSGSIRVPENATEVELYFSFNHDFIDSEDLTYNKIAFSENPNNFDSTEMYSMEILPIPLVEEGFYGEDVMYTHKVTINPNGDLDPDVILWFFRVYVQDDMNPVTEIPTNDGIYYVKNYMSFEKVE